MERRVREKWETVWLHHSLPVDSQTSEESCESKKVRKEERESDQNNKTKLEKLLICFSPNVRLEPPKSRAKAGKGRKKAKKV
jgi:hypothetical protein